MRTPSCSGAFAAAAATSGSSTEFEFRLHPVGPTVLAGPIFWPMEETPALMRFYREWIAEAPDELMTIPIQRRAPPLTSCRRSFAANSSS